MKQIQPCSDTSESKVHKRNKKNTKKENGQKSSKPMPVVKEPKIKVSVISIYINVLDGIVFLIVPRADVLTN